MEEEVGTLLGRGALLLGALPTQQAMSKKRVFIFPIKPRSFGQQRIGPIGTKRPLIAIHSISHLSEGVRRQIQTMSLS
jgi:hypothetical protein